MKNLYSNADTEAIVNRIDQLKPDSERLWGKMDVAQMMAHCSAALEMATGHTSPSRLLIGRILGPLVKSGYLSDKPFPKNSPTDKTFIITDKRVFEKERTKLKKLVMEFANGGAEKCTAHPHSFFGKLTPQEWSSSMYKHLDHHLHQFGV